MLMNCTGSLPTTFAVLEAIRALLLLYRYSARLLCAPLPPGLIDRNGVTHCRSMASLPELMWLKLSSVLPPPKFSAVTRPATPGRTAEIPLNACW